MSSTLYPITFLFPAKLVSIAMLAQQIPTAAAGHKLSRLAKSYLSKEVQDASIQDKSHAQSQYI